MEQQSENGISLKDFLKKNKLPQMVKVVSGMYDVADEISLAREEILTLHSLNKYETVKATDEEDHTFFLPLNVTSTVAIVSETTWRQTYEDIETLSDEFPSLVISTHDHADLGIERGDILKLIHTKYTGPREGFLQCALVNKPQKDDIFIPLSSNAMFETVESSDQNALYLKEVVTNYMLPIKIKVLEDRLTIRKFDVNFCRPTGLDKLGNITLHSQSEINIVIATTTGQDSTKNHHSLISIPDDLDIKVVPLRNTSRKRTKCLAELDFCDISFVYGSAIITESPIPPVQNDIEDSEQDIPPPLPPRICNAPFDDCQCDSCHGSKTRVNIENRESEAGANDNLIDDVCHSNGSHCHSNGSLDNIDSGVTTSTDDYESIEIASNNINVSNGSLDSINAAGVTTSTDNYETIEITNHIVNHKVNSCHGNNYDNMNFSDSTQIGGNDNVFGIDNHSNDHCHGDGIYDNDPSTEPNADVDIGGNDNVVGIDDHSNNHCHGDGIYDNDPSTENETEPNAGVNIIYDVCHDNHSHSTYEDIVLKNVSPEDSKVFNEAHETKLDCDTEKKASVDTSKPLSGDHSVGHGFSSSLLVGKGESVCGEATGKDDADISQKQDSLASVALPAINNSFPRGNSDYEDISDFVNNRFNTLPASFRNQKPKRSGLKRFSNFARSLKRSQSATDVNDYSYASGSGANRGRFFSLRRGFQRQKAAQSQTRWYV